MTTHVSLVTNVVIWILLEVVIIRPVDATTLVTTSTVYWALVFLFKLADIAVASILNKESK